MELTYQIMLYGGIVGAIVTLSIAIWLFIKLDIADVIQDLTGIRVKKQKRNQNNADFEMWHNQGSTSSSIRLKRLHSTHENMKKHIPDKQVPQIDETPQKNVQMAPPVNDDDQTELLEETTALGDETELISEEKEGFVMEEDVVIVHEVSKQKEGSK